MPPEQLGPYKIEASIGAGGMGQVFRATDTRLQRTVAIKVLPHDKVADPERKRRFLQEARAASALNHPNIVTVHDIASDGGIDYLVMEYVPGKSLDKLIVPGGLPLADVVAYAAQISAALAAAHAAGIVHRDIKPANLVVTAEGQVKVLDFGLAKLEDRPPQPEDETQTMVTKAGLIMGTAAYMSPEQARAEPVDGRTDLFSFGAVLYEVATGQRPFRKAFDWSPPDAAALPPSLRPIVMKLLEADPALRYQTATGVAADLKRLQSPHEPKANSARWWIAAAAMLALGILVAAAILYLRPHPPAGRDQWVQLTRFPDSVSQPALSPDGRMLAFVRGFDTFSAAGEIYLKMLPDGDPVQLTHDELKVNKMSPVFSPDGSRIAYTVTTYPKGQGQKWDTWIVPVVSGQPRLWLANASGLIWSDKQRVLFSEIKDHNIHMGIVAAEESRAAAHDIYLPAGARGMAHRSYPSPDGKSALVVEMNSGWLPCRLVPVDGTSPGRPVGPPGASCTFASWSPDGKWMYFSSSAGGNFHTWRQRYPDGKPEQITSGPTEEEGIAMAADGRSFITAVALNQSVVRLHEAGGERQISLEGYSYDPQFTPDGKKLCYRILKGALPAFDASELRVVELNTGHNESLLPGLEITGRPGLAYTISPDGLKVVAAAKDGEGKQRLWVAALDRQSPPHPISGVEGRTPHFGKDGEIFFRGIESPTSYVYAVHEDGTGLRRVSEQSIVGIYGITQDGQWVIARPETGLTRALRIDGGATLAVAGGIMAWSADGKRLFVSQIAGPNASNILGRTIVVPLPPGRMFPDAGATATDLVNLPGASIIDAYAAAPGPSPEVYAYARQTVQRNLYRIPIP